MDRIEVLQRCQERADKKCLQQGHLWNHKKSKFQIPSAQFSWIPDSTCKNFSHSGIRIAFHGARPVDISRRTMEFDREPEEASASLDEDQVHDEPFYRGYDFVFVDKLSPGQISSVFLFHEECCPDPGFVLFWPLQIPWLSPLPFTWRFQVFHDLMFSCHFWKLFLF